MAPNRGQPGDRSAKYHAFSLFLQRTAPASIKLGEDFAPYSFPPRAVSEKRISELPFESEDARKAGAKSVRRAMEGLRMKTIVPVRMKLGKKSGRFDLDGTLNEDLHRSSARADKFMLKGVKPTKCSSFLPGSARVKFYLLLASSDVFVVSGGLADTGGGESWCGRC